MLLDWKLVLLFADPAEGAALGVALTITQF